MRISECSRALPTLKILNLRKSCRLCKAGLEKLAEIKQQDILTVDLSPATVVTMYLLPDVNLKLKPNLLKQLKPGSRVVSHAFDMGDWKPDKTERVNGRTIYLWTIPAKAP
jgi:hypothetical protein